MAVLIENHDGLLACTICWSVSGAHCTCSCVDFRESRLEMIKASFAMYDREDFWAKDKLLWRLATTLRNSALPRGRLEESLLVVRLHG